MSIVTEGDLARLDSIALQLNDLAEQFYSELIDEGSYAFNIHDVLAHLPMLKAPAHNAVLKRIKDWKDAALVPPEVAENLRQRVLSASRNSSGAGGSVLRVPLVQENSETPTAADKEPSSPKAGTTDAGLKRSPRLQEKAAAKKQRADATYIAPAKGQMQLSFSRMLTVSSASGGKATVLPVVTPVAKPTAPPVAAVGSKRKSDEVKLEADGTGTRAILKLHVVAGTTIVAVQLSVKKISAAAVLGLTNKRRTHTIEEKQRALDSVKHLGTVGEKAKALQKVSGFEYIQGRDITRWEVNKVPKKMGKPRNCEFDHDVLDQMVYTQVANKDDPDSVAVIANVAYSYQAIVVAARLVQKWPVYQSDPKVAKLMFSHVWVKDFIDRNDLHRRRVSTTDKVLPPILEVQDIMKEIAEAQANFELDEIISADETGVFYGLQPKNQYVSTLTAGDVRGAAPDSDEKARFTSMQAGVAGTAGAPNKGAMLASFNIVKCSSTKPDLSNTRVLKEIHTRPGFTVADGWELLHWKRTLTILNKKKEEVSATYSRPYLKEKETGTIITIQHKAWMDTAGICMWLDTLLGPHFASKRGKAYLIWDNCGSHCVHAIKPVLEQWGITEKKLPKNMTGKLQVMDLVVNGPYKAAIRRKRISSLFMYFQSWKINRLQEMAKAPEERNLPPFKPPKPDLYSGLKNSFEVECEIFTKDSFREALARTFVAAGQAPGKDGKFQIYKTHARSSIASHLLPQGAVEDCPTLATVAGGADVTPYEDEDEPETDDETHDDVDD